MKKKIAGLGLRILVAVILLGTGYFTATAVRAETVVFEAESFIEQAEGYWRNNYLNVVPSGQTAVYEYCLDANMALATISLRLNCTGLKIRYLADYYKGICDIIVDGYHVYFLDCYSPTRQEKIETVVNGLTPGEHEIEIVCSGTANPSATQKYGTYYYDFDKFEAENYVPPTPPHGTLANPINNASLSGSALVSGICGDDYRVARIDIKLNDKIAHTVPKREFSLDGSDVSWTYSLDTMRFQNGTYTLVAVASDECGAATELGSRIIYINNDNVNRPVAYDKRFRPHLSMGDPLNHYPDGPFESVQSGAHGHDTDYPDEIAANYRNLTEYFGSSYMRLTPRNIYDGYTARKMIPFDLLSHSERDGGGEEGLRYNAWCMPAGSVYEIFGELTNAEGDDNYDPSRPIYLTPEQYIDQAIIYAAIILDEDPQAKLAFAALNCGIMGNGLDEYLIPVVRNFYRRAYSYLKTRPEWVGNGGWFDFDYWTISNYAGKYPDLYPDKLLKVVHSFKEMFATDPVFNMDPQSDPNVLPPKKPMVLREWSYRHGYYSGTSDTPEYQMANIMVMDAVINGTSKYAGIRDLLDHAGESWMWLAAFDPVDKTTVKHELTSLFDLATGKVYSSGRHYMDLAHGGFGYDLSILDSNNIQDPATWELAWKGVNGDRYHAFDIWSTPKPHMNMEENFDTAGSMSAWENDVDEESAFAWDSQDNNGYILAALGNTHAYNALFSRSFTNASGKPIIYNYNTISGNEYDQSGQLTPVDMMRSSFRFQVSGEGTESGGKGSIGWFDSAYGKSSVCLELAAVRGTNAHDIVYDLGGTNDIGENLTVIPGISIYKGGGTLPPPTDSDGDGMPDWWEQLYQ